MKTQTTFSERDYAATLHETTVKEAIQEYGWHVRRFDIAVCPQVIRDNAGFNYHRVRWAPDFDIWSPNYRTQVLIDAKTSLSDTTNWAIELESFDVMRELCRAFNVNGFFVLPDMTAIHVTRLWRTKFAAQQLKSNGSGTPFILTPKEKHTNSLFDELSKLP